MAETSLARLSVLAGNSGMLHYSTTRSRIYGASSSEICFLVAEDPLPPLRLTFYINLVACVALATCLTAPQAALRVVRNRQRSGGSSAAHAPVPGSRGIEQVAAAVTSVCMRSQDLQLPAMPPPFGYLCAPCM